MVKTIYPDSTSSSVDYICCGMPGVQTDRAGRKSYTDYDPLKRVVRVQDALGQSVSYDYDLNGNLTRLTDAKVNRTGWRYDLFYHAP